MAKEPVLSVDWLRDELKTMGGEVLARFRRVRKALAALDVEAARQAVDEDARTDAQEVAIEQGCLALLTGPKPGRLDMRSVMAVIKINTDLERIGDMAVNIAECIEPLPHTTAGRVPDEIPEMERIVHEMLTDALDSFGKRDTVLAGRVRQRDDAVDVLNEEAYRLLLEDVAHAPEHLEFATHYIVIAKNLERIGDLCTNIAEHVVFMETGEIVRHKAKP
ncbi:MAG TPA: phosphate signaling complex protein PhoU [Phycisphaerae bacterium]|nr:phosphate signaling complex protein PhoU [Phycisphaerae bacterium]